jgi:hypothetical protein
MDEATRRQLFLTLTLFQVELNQQRAKVEAGEQLLKAHPELYGEFQDYERKRLYALQNPRQSTSLDVDLEALRRNLIPEHLT